MSDRVEDSVYVPCFLAEMEEVVVRTKDTVEVLDLWLISAINLGHA